MLQFLNVNDRAWIVKFRTLALGPAIEPAHVDFDLSVGCYVHVGAVHRPRRRTLEIDTLRIVAAAMARTFEFVFCCFPIRRASQMSAHRVNDEDALSITHHPDAIFILKFCIYAE